MNIAFQLLLILILISTFVYLVGLTTSRENTKIPQPSDGHPSDGHPSQQTKIQIQTNLNMIHESNIQQSLKKDENNNYSKTVFGANKFIPYSYDEFINLFTGLVIPDEFLIPPTEEVSITGGFKIDFDKIPSTEAKKDIFYEISPKLLGQVEDQGPCGSCWAFSACAVLGAQATKNFVAESPINVSVQHYINCVTQNMGCKGGFPVYVYDKVADDGFLVINLLDINIPYEQEQQKCDIPDKKSELPVDFKGILGVGIDDIMYFPKGKDPTRIERYRNIQLNIPSDELKEKIKKILFTYGPMTALIYVDKNLPYVASGIYLGTDTKDGEKVNPNHAVVIAGYGVDLDGDDYWIIRNSWGRDWADGGYFQLSTKSPISGITLPFIGSEPPYVS